jgi:hypothetical protein
MCLSHADKATLLSSRGTLHLVASRIRFAGRVGFHSMDPGVATVPSGVLNRRESCGPSPGTSALWGLLSICFIASLTTVAIAPVF